MRVWVWKLLPAAINELIIVVVTINQKIVGCVMFMQCFSDTLNGK